MLRGFICSLKAAGSVIFVMLLLLFLFALLGKQLFGKKLDREERYNYDDFLWSFVTVFVVRTAGTVTAAPTHQVRVTFHSPLPARTGTA